MSQKTIEELLRNADAGLLRELIAEHAREDEAFRKHITERLADAPPPQPAPVERGLGDFFIGLNDKMGLVIRCIREENYRRAEELCFEQIEEERAKARPGRPARVYMWYERLEEIYAATGKTEQREEAARQVLLAGFVRYFRTVKELLVTLGRWDAERDALIEELSRCLPVNKFMEVLEQNGDFRRLLDLVETTPGDGVFVYGACLMKAYPEETITVYRRRIEEMAVPVSSGEVYRTICRRLEQLRSIGGDELVRTMIAEFLIRYKNRKSFVKELKLLQERMQG